jgi:hypothetical protein
MGNRMLCLALSATTYTMLMLTKHDVCALCVGVCGWFCRWSHTYRSLGQSNGRVSLRFNLFLK